ncbi:MAG: sialidase family protein, partial [Acidimicrobiia bacterium]
MSILKGRQARAGLTASLLALGLPLTMASVALSDPGPTLSPQESANYLRSTDGGDDFDPQSIDNVGLGVGQVTQVEAEDGTVHALFGTNNDDDDFAFPFELYHRRSTDGGEEFDAGRRLDDDTGISSEPSLATTGPDVHVAFEENRLAFGLDTNGDGVDPDDEFPEEVFYTRSTDEGETFSTAVNLSQTVNAQETDNDTAALGDRVGVVYESNQIDPDDFDPPAPTITAEEATTARDIVIRVSDDRGANFADDINLTFDGTTAPPFELDDTSGQGQDQPKVALNDDVVLVVFRIESADELTYRIGYVRSTDGGANFGGIMVLPSAVNTDDLPSLYMDGDDAQVFACDVNNQLLQWRSGDAGATFGAAEVVHTGSE